MTSDSSPTPSLAEALPDDATVTYQFRDASVPPKFHRSVRVTVTKDSSRIAIDSYGDVLAERSTPTPPAVWSALAGALTDLEHLAPSPAPEGCTGGTGRSVQVTSGARSLADVSAEFCGGSNAGLDVAMDAWIQPARSLFPSTEDLAPTGAG